ncbi:MAG TPA: hypothetical protein VGC79_02550 [Polyangiaceae bacterium]
MVGSDGSNRSRRRWRPTLITTIIALAAQACSSSTLKPSPATAGVGGTGEGGAGGERNAGAGRYSFGGVDLSSPDYAASSGCGGGGLFAEQMVAAQGGRLVLYSWTTDEQVAELRAGGPLFSRSESPGKGRGLAMTQLVEFAAEGTEPAHRLAASLAGTVFAKLRFSWPNPWATLMGWPGETYGNQLLQVTLRPEAWIANFIPSRGLSVVDSSNQPIDIATAAANPERIGAIYFQSESVDGQVSCGTFSHSYVAFREYVLGNLPMVQSWSLATPEIRAQLEADIATLEAFSKELSCYQLPPAQARWYEDAMCAVNLPYDLGGSQLRYDLALGMPSELYWPSPENLAALVAALRVSLPTGEPLVVEPGG